jgi:CrcB protein
MTPVLVALAGAVGAVLRVVVDRVVRRGLGAGDPDAGPWGTLVVNVTGSLALGVVAGLVLYHGLAERPRLVVGVGFLGAYTTFSTFSLDVVGLVENGSGVVAVRYVLGSVGLSLLAAGAGLALAAAL